MKSDFGQPELSGFPKRHQGGFCHVSLEWHTGKGSKCQQEASGKQTFGLVEWCYVRIDRSFIVFCPH